MPMRDILVQVPKSIEAKARVLVPEPIEVGLETLMPVLGSPMSKPKFIEAKTRDLGACTQVH